MNKEKQELKELNFKYRLIEAKRINYFEKDIDESIFRSKFNKRSVAFKLNLQLKIDDSYGTIELILEVKFYYKSNNHREELFGIRTSHKFKIKNFKEVFPSKNKKKYIIPDKVTATFLGIAISGTRGMLVILNTNKYYKDILLPLINPLDIIKKGEKSKSKSSIL